MLNSTLYPDDIVRDPYSIAYYRSKLTIIALEFIEKYNIPRNDTEAIDYIDDLTEGKKCFRGFGIS